MFWVLSYAVPPNAKHTPSTQLGLFYVEFIRILSMPNKCIPSQFPSHFAVFANSLAFCLSPSGDSKTLRSLLQSKMERNCVGMDRTGYTPSPSSDFDSRRNPYPVLSLRDNPCFLTYSPKDYFTQEMYLTNVHYLFPPTFERVRMYVETNNFHQHLLSSRRSVSHAHECPNYIHALLCFHRQRRPVGASRLLVISHKGAETSAYSLLRLATAKADGWSKSIFQLTFALIRR